MTEQGRIVETEARVTVEVVEGEYVAGRGHRKVHWLVRYRDAWLRAVQYPGAVSERRDAGAGTVWENVIALSVPVGTSFTRIESRPLPGPSRSPLEYLERGDGEKRRVTRVAYRAGRRGELQKAP